MLFGRTPRPIARTTWRYKIAQWVLHALYGRKQHYISPWAHVGVAANVYLFHNGNVLTARRAPHIEDPNLFECTLGGHIDAETHEGLLEGLNREVYEELGITIDVSRLDVHTPFSVTMNYGVDYHELPDGANIALNYVYALSDDEAARITPGDEVRDVHFASLEEMEKIDQQGEFCRCMDELRAAFAFYHEHLA